MRSGVFILFLILYHSVWGQEAVITVKDSLPVPEEIIENKKDSILIVDKIIKDKSIDSLTIKDKLSKSKAIDSTSKRFIPYIKPMERVTVEDYKILHFDGSETIVDTTLSLEGEYAFNFLRKDYFELLPLPNMGEGFNKLGYDFHEDPLTPQMGARVKHFGYFEKEDVNYYEVPSPYTELFFKSTFQNGQNLDATLAINTSPKFNIAVSFKGFRSLGKYFSSLSRSRQFRLSTQYQTYDKRYRLRLHQTTQSLENEVNGGLTNDAVYFFENAPNYVVADTSGIPILNENGEEEYIFYDGFLNRSILSTQIRAENELEGKRYFMEHQYQMLPVSKDSMAYKMTLGYRVSLENKKYNYSQDRVNYFFEAYSPNVIDSIDNSILENNVYVTYKDQVIGDLKLDVYHYKWKYALGPNDYEKDTILPTKIDASQLAAQVRWSKSLFGFSAEAEAYQSFKEEFATTAFKGAIRRELYKDISASASYRYRSQPLNFNFHLFQSDFEEYNWSNANFINQNTATKGLSLFHPKWGTVAASWSTIDNYGFFNNTTRLADLNKKFKVVALQSDKQIDYFKARFDQRFDFGKFSWVNNVQYQKVTQEENVDEILSGPLALNVPEWLIRSTLMLTSSIFNKALFFQSGATFTFFTDYYADQYNPLIAEFVTQNNTKIGEYPRVDFFFNAKIQSSRIYIKLENISAPIEHLIKVDTPYDYYAAPFTPYRDFAVRFGLIWNFFQ